jgi:hypothetical protein
MLTRPAALELPVVLLRITRENLVIGQFGPR